ncbi:flagellar basal body P-ring formation chaperone FlgA [Pseudoalteromonas aurantia]|uniref:Flagella basal body P-ring formation protein FlgA n=1 Tax=Pseudoalteromonas aurantia TaxID=43654 RepID=A0A5S3V5Y8_9GAMM|nr:flagellar basal body P-ring formation chaperone FlgA [Pseudoalteromonas aurantia]TMO66622.1 flagella basal body P-ring formation protein FlgA [Pseudoalteromonas aurantia]
MRFAYFICVLFVFSWCATAEVAGRIEHATFKGSTPLLLGDLIHFTGGTAERRARLANVELQWPENKMMLTASALQKHARSIDDQLGDDWTTEGYKQVFVKQCWRLSKIELEKKVKRYLYKSFNSEYVRFRNVKFSGNEQDLCLIENPIHFDMEMQNVAVVFERQRVNILIEDRVVLSPVLDVSIEEKVAVTNVAKRRGDRILLSEVSWEWVPTSRVNMNELGNSYNNLIVTRNIKRGGRLKSVNTKIRPDVLKGKWVELSMRSGGISIKGKAKALSDGVIGETIQVVLDGQGQSISAKVVSKGAVVVSN